METCRFLRQCTVFSYKLIYCSYTPFLKDIIGEVTDIIF